MALTREQELFLIRVGIDALNSAFSVKKLKRNWKPWNKGLKTGPRNKIKWTKERREKFSRTMAKKWANKKSE